MMPMSPRGTALAKASGAPPMMAVPQSGPITSRPSSRASRLSASSSASGTLSLKIMHMSPRCSALRASAAANSPGTEISARLASGCRCSAAAKRARIAMPAARGGRCAAGRARSARRRARLVPVCVALGLDREDQIVGLAAASPSQPAGRHRAGSRLLAGVPIISAASSTPGSATRSRATGASAPPSRDRSPCGPR